MERVINFFRILSFFGLVVVFACGSGTLDQGEDFGDILDSDEGIVLTEGEHLFGWGRDDCLMCHNLNNIHREDRSDDIDIDVEEIQEQTFEEGESVCMDCHGTNGTDD